MKTYDRWERMVASYSVVFDPNVSRLCVCVRVAAKTDSILAWTDCSVCSGYGIWPIPWGELG